MLPAAQWLLAITLNMLPSALCLPWLDQSLTSIFLIDEKL